MLCRSCYIILLSITVNANAQTLPFKKYTAKDGLNSKIIYTAIRDDRGLLWVGTSFGINWFDGSRFYQPPVPKKVDQLFVLNFYKDKEGNIWTMTFYNGLYKFQNDHFTNYLIDSSYTYINKNNLFEMLEISPGRYIVGGDGNVYLFDGKIFIEFDPSNNDLHMQVHALGQLADGSLLIGCKGLLCYQYKNNKWNLTQKILPGREINKIITDHDDLWVATDKGLYHFANFNANTNEKDPEIFLEGKAVSHCSENNKGEIWLSTGDATYRINGKSISVYNEKDGLANGSQQTYTDAQGLTWISSFQGLFKLGKVSYTYRRLQPEAFNDISSIARDKNNTIWTGHNNGYASIDGKYSYNFPLIKGKQAEGTTLFYAPLEKKLWASNKQGIFEIKNDKPEKRFPFECSAFYEDAQGRLWIATPDGLLFVYDQKQLQALSFPHFQYDFISSIIQDKKGFTWLGLRTGGILKCTRLDSALTKVAEYTQATGFFDMHIRSCISDGKGNILFGTRTNSLFIFSEGDEKKYWHINSEKGLNASWIKTMAGDESNIYLATNNGLVVLKKEGGYENPSIHAVNFSDESISKETGGVLADNGEVWLGVNGIVNYFPNKDKPDSGSSPVYFTDVRISGKPDSSLQPYMTQDHPLHLPYSKNVMSFAFEGIHLQDESPLHYRYKMKGQDKDWEAVTDRNFVSYNLPPGHYEFDVEAQNENGEWSKQPAKYEFIIRQPFWSTWWFITLLAIATAGIIYAIYRYRVKQLLKLAKLRSRISTDLHDEIGSTLSSISILSEMVLHSNNGHHQMVAEIKENSLALMEKMDDIVWSINPKNDSLENLLIRIKHFSSRLFEAKDIDYKIEIDKTVSDLKLSMENRQHIYMIMKEAINNLVKYSGCTAATIRVEYIHSNLEIGIEDNGKGFNAAEERNGNGIINMKSRAALMRAQLVIRSEQGKGTSVQLKTKIK